MSHEQVILWDFDGTLGHRPGMWSQALIDVLVETRPECTITVEDIRPFLREGFPWHHSHIPHTHITTAEMWWNELEFLLVKAFCGIGCSTSQAQRLAILAHHRYLAADGWLLYDDVLPTLELLSHQGWEHSILSNHVPELPTIVTALGLSPYVKTVISSAFLGYEKPHPQAFLSVRERLGNPRTLWMVGDNIDADIIGAEQVGIPAILVRKQDTRASRSCLTLSSLLELLTGA